MSRSGRISDLNNLVDDVNVANNSNNSSSSRSGSRSRTSGSVGGGARSVASQGRPPPQRRPAADDASISSFSQSIARIARASEYKDRPISTSRSLGADELRSRSQGRSSLENGRRSSSTGRRHIPPPPPHVRDTTSASRSSRVEDDPSTTTARLRSLVNEIQSSSNFNSMSLNMNSENIIHTSDNRSVDEESLSLGSGLDSRYYLRNPNRRVMMPPPPPPPRGGSAGSSQRGGYVIPHMGGRQEQGGGGGTRSVNNNSRTPSDPSVTSRSQHQPSDPSVASSRRSGRSSRYTNTSASHDSSDVGEDDPVGYVMPMGMGMLPDGTVFSQNTASVYGSQRGGERGHEEGSYVSGGSGQSGSYVSGSYASGAGSFQNPNMQITQFQYGDASTFGSRNSRSIAGSAALIPKAKFSWANESLGTQSTVMTRRSMASTTANVPEPTQDRRSTEAEGRIWASFAWFVTFPIPNACIMRPTKDAKQAWREKVALFLIMVSCSVFFVGVFGFVPLLLCSEETVYSIQDVWLQTGENWVIVHGTIYDVKDLIYKHPGGVDGIVDFLGKDASKVFPRAPPATLPEKCLDMQKVDAFQLNVYSPENNFTNPTCASFTELDQLLGITCHTFAAGSNGTQKFLGPYERGILKHTTYALQELGVQYITIYDRVYDVSTYVKSVRENQEPAPSGEEPSLNNNPAAWLTPTLNKVIMNSLNSDATDLYEALFGSVEYIACLEELFYSGLLDDNPNTFCATLNIMMYCMLIMVALLMVVQFLASMIYICPRNRTYTEEDVMSPVMVMVPCYNEGDNELRKTIKSVLNTSYPDENKVLFMVADGLVTGNGEDMSTPEHLANILGFDIDEFEDDTFEYDCIGVVHTKNRARVYHGILQKGHKFLKYIAIVKCGLPEEATTSAKPGNRGKRDSQLITIGYYNRIHYGHRMLTTLLLKYYPDRSLTFIPEAACWTIVPHTFKILLSQRRRWINSTVHNMFELLKVNTMCGVCCVSMKVVVFIDLIATMILPASYCYAMYLLFLVFFEDLPVSIVLLILYGIIMGVQVVVFILRSRWEYIWWFFIYFTVGLPVFYLVLPTYSFWNMDDFSWGKTRSVGGNAAKNATGEAESSEDDEEARSLLDKDRDTRGYDDEDDEIYSKNYDDYEEEDDDEKSTESSSDEKSHDEVSDEESDEDSGSESEYDESHYSRSQYSGSRR
eukprot:scaffold10780_cov78-Cyclotella_meneghiniana.AAC.1